MFPSLAQASHLSTSLKMGKLRQGHLQHTQPDNESKDLGPGKGPSVCLPLCCLLSLQGQGHAREVGLPASAHRGHSAEEGAAGEEGAASKLYTPVHKSEAGPRDCPAAQAQEQMAMIAWRPSSRAL